MSKPTAREKVFALFKDAKDPMTPLSIAKKTRLNKNTVRRVVQELLKDGKISKAKRGTYSLK